MESYCLMGIESQFCKMKRVLEMDGGDVCTTICVVNTSELCSTHTYMHIYICTYFSQSGMLK